MKLFIINIFRIIFIVIILCVLVSECYNICNDLEMYKVVYSSDFTRSLYGGNFKTYLTTIVIELILALTYLVLELFHLTKRSNNRRLSFALYAFDCIFFSLVITKLILVHRL